MRPAQAPESAARSFSRSCCRNSIQSLPRTLWPSKRSPAGRAPHQGSRVETSTMGRSPVAASSASISSWFASRYWSVFRGNGKRLEEHYAPLRNVLRQAEEIVGEYPALAGIERRDDQAIEFGARILNRGLATSQLSMVAGVMFRAAEVGKNGFAAASRELQGIGEPSGYQHRPLGGCGPWRAGSRLSPVGRLWSVIR